MNGRIKVWMRWGAGRVGGVRAESKEAAFPRRDVGCSSRASIQGLLTVLLSVFGIQQAIASDILFSSSGGSAWLTAGNWTGGAVPTATDNAQIGANPTSGTTGIGINGNGTLNPGSGVQDIGAIEVTSARNNLNMLIGNSTTSAGKSMTLALKGTTVNGVANTILRNNGTGTTTLTLQNTQASGTQLMGVRISNSSAVINTVGNIVISSVLSSSTAGYGFTKTGNGTLTLSADNTLSGDVSLNAGTLALSGAGAVSSIANLVLGSGSTFDTSGRTGALTMGSGQCIKSSATGSSTTGTLRMGSSQGITLSSSGLVFTAYGGGATAPLTVSNAGSLALNSAPVTVTTTTALAAGNYTLIAKSGSATVSGTAGTLTVDGSGVASGCSASLTVTSGELILQVQATAPTVTSSAATGIGTTSATLNGNVTSDGGSAVTDRGFCYKTSSPVTISDNKTTVSGTTGSYTLGPTLSVNTRYYWVAYAINGVGTTLSSPELNFWTLANVPTAPTVGNPTSSSLDVTIGASDGNPSGTLYAIQETGGQYVQAGGALGASAVYQAASTWGTRTVSGLSSSTTYTFQVKAQNGASTDTTFGPTANGTTSASGGAGLLGSLYYRGELNSWGSSALSLVGDVWRVTAQAPGDDSASEFKMDRYGDWSQSFGRGSTMGLASVETLYASGGNGSFNAANGRYYTFSVKDITWANNTLVAVQETANSPITFSRAGQDASGRMDPNDANTVTLTLSSGTHTEDLYVRYTTDGWTSSSFVKASGSGTTLSADIPAQSRGTVVQYYTFSTTFGTPTHADADLQTISFDNTGYGNNTTYTNWDLGNTWSYATTSVSGGGGATFLNGGAGAGGWDFVGNESAAYVYSGNQDSGGGDAADQSALTLYFKKSTESTWNNSAGNWQHNNGNDKYWMASFNFAANGYVPGDTIQYYLKVEYASGAVTTYIYGNGAASNNNSYITGFESAATNAPFTFRYGFPAPTATTGPASATNVTSVTVTGTVNDNGASATPSFEYGTSASYGSTQAATPSPVTGGTNTGVSATLSGLSANTLYHYRLKAVNSGGTNYGSDATVTTLNIPPPANVRASATNATDFTAAWDAADGADSYRLDVSANATFTLTSSLPTTNAYHNGQAGQGTGGTWTETGLLQASGYLALQDATDQLITPAMDFDAAAAEGLKFRARTYGGVSGSSADITVTISTNNGSSWTTLGTRTPGSTTMTDMSPFDVSGYGGTQVRVRLQALSANGTAGVGVDDITVTSLTTTVSANYLPAYSNRTVSATSEAVTNLAPSSTYYFRVRATDGSTTSVNSSTGSVTTLAPTLPAVTTEAVSGRTNTAATLNGNVSSEGTGAVTNRGFYYGTAAGITNSNTLAPDGSGSGGYSAAIGSLTANTRYYYRAYATSAYGTTWGAESNFLTLAGVPDQPTISNTNQTSLDVTLSVNGNPAATEFAIHETTLGKFVQGDGTLGDSAVWATAATWGTKTVTSLTPNTDYTFEAKARNADNEETAYGTAQTAHTAALVPQATIATTPAMTEANLNGKLITVTLANESFTNAGASLQASDFTLNNAPSGMTVGSVQNAGATSCEVVVSFDGTDFDSDVSTFSITIKQTQLVNSASDLTSYNTLAITAVVETAPTVATGAHSAETRNGATLDGDVTATGGMTVTERGVCVALTSNPATNDLKFAFGTGGTGAFSVSATGLAANTAYHYRAYAINGIGTSYGSDSNFTTLNLSAPTNVHAAATNITDFTAAWDAVDGAAATSGYRLDVSTSPNFNTSAHAADLIISEYLEGSSNNKYLEIYNGTAGSVDLANYKVAVYANGGTSPSTITLTGSLAAGAAYVVAYNQAALNVASNLASATLSFNGDDAVALTNVLTGLVDVIGRIGEDPGTEWTGSGVSTLNQTLRRKASIRAGDTNGTDAFDPSVQWDSYAIDTVSGLGSHSFDPVPSYVVDYSNRVVTLTSEVVTNLAANTPYYFRVRATDGSATSANSTTGTVTTLAMVPPTVSTEAVSGRTNDAATLYGNVSSEGTASVTGKGFYYDTASGITNTDTLAQDGDSGSGTFDVALSSLTPNTRYYYRACATSAHGTSWGGESNFLTLASTPVQPTIGNTNQTTLDVAISANGNPAATAFAIHESTLNKFVQADGSLGDSEVWATAATWGTKTVIGLSADTDYTFEVKARNADNEETAYGASRTGHTLAVPSPGIDVPAASLPSFGVVPLGTSAASQSYTVSASNLTEDVTVTAPAEFEVSTDNATFTQSVTLTQSGGNASATVYARLTPATTGAKAGNITHTSAGAVQKDVAVSGSGGLAAPANARVTATNTTSFAAAWDSVTGATEYRLDVSTNSAFSVMGSSNVYTTGFEDASKGSYTSGNVTLSGASWNLSDALIGNTVGSDRFNDAASARFRTNGVVQMNADLSNGLQSVTLLYAQYGADGLTTGRVDYSTNGGGAWSTAGYFTNASTSLTRFEATNLNLTGTVRVRIAHAGPSGTKRFNVDDINLYPNPQATPNYVAGYSNLAVAGTSATISSLTQNTTYHFRVRATDGSVTSANSAMQSLTTLAINSDSHVGAPAAQIAAGDVSSLADTAGEAVDVFKFKVVDAGSGDATATKVTHVRILPAAGNTADWTDSIAGVKLIAGSDVTIGAPTISDTAIDIPIVAGNLDVADAASQDVRLQVYLKSAVVDNSVLQFKVAQTGHGFTADPLGSTFAADFGAETTGNAMTIRVVATALVFSTAPTAVPVATDFSATVQARDANGNVDLDSTASVTITRASGTGTLTGGGAQSLASGTKTFSTLQMDTAGTFTLQAAGGGLATGTSSPIEAQEPPLVISGYLANPAGTDSPYEYVQVKAVRNVNFATTPVSIVWLNNGTAPAVGWAGGTNTSYKFNITSGTMGENEIAYVGGGNRLINGSGSADISSAQWLRIINTGTTGGDGFGNSDSNGVLGNGGTPDGIGIFLGTTLTSNSVPVDAVFFGTSNGTAVVSSGTAGYTLPINDHYSGGFLQTNSYMFPDPDSGGFVRLTGTYNTLAHRWTVARTATTVSSPTQASQIQSAIYVKTGMSLFLFK